jgi:hypothetical protein
MWGAKPPTFWRAFPGPRGRPDLKIAPPKSGQTAFRYPESYSTASAKLPKDNIITSSMTCFNATWNGSSRPARVHGPLLQLLAWSRPAPQSTSAMKCETNLASYTAADTTTRSTFKIEDPSLGPGRVHFRGPDEGFGLEGTPKPQIQRDPSPPKGNLICGPPL